MMDKQADDPWLDGERDGAPAEPAVLDERTSDETIRKVIERLARPHPTGGYVVERAAILAEGSKAPAIFAWIAARGGAPESTAVRGVRRGLHGTLQHAGGSTPTTRPARYILPAVAISPPA